MKKATVVLCSFASITEEVLDKYGIIALEPKLDWPEKESLKGENIFEKMRDAYKKGVNSFPKTSQPSMGAIKVAFEKAFENAENVICITISSKISGTYNATLQTKKLFSKEKQERIHIIDSNNIDAAESLLAIKASELSIQGEEIEKIVSTINELTAKTYFFGMTENAKQMEAGGRTSHVLAVALTQMQKIGLRPLLHMKDGLVSAADLKVNAKDTAGALFKHFKSTNKKSISEGVSYKVAISHADNFVEAQKLKVLLEKEYPNQVKVCFLSITGVFIGSHVGPGTLMMCSIPEL